MYHIRLSILVSACLMPLYIISMHEPTLPFIGEPRVTKATFDVPLWALAARQIIANVEGGCKKTLRDIEVLTADCEDKIASQLAPKFDLMAQWISVGLPRAHQLTFPGYPFGFVDNQMILAARERKVDRSISITSPTIKYSGIQILSTDHKAEWPHYLKEDSVYETIKVSPEGTECMIVPSEAHEDFIIRQCKEGVIVEKPVFKSCLNGYYSLDGSKRILEMAEDTVIVEDVNEQEKSFIIPGAKSYMGISDGCIVVKNSADDSLGYYSLEDKKLVQTLKSSHTLAGIVDYYSKDIYGLQQRGDCTITPVLVRYLASQSYGCLSLKEAKADRIDSNLSSSGVVGVTKARCPQSGMVKEEEDRVITFYSSELDELGSTKGVDYAISRDATQFVIADKAGTIDHYNLNTLRLVDLIRLHCDMQKKRKNLKKLDEAAMKGSV